MPILDQTNKKEVERYDSFVRNSKFRSLTQDRVWAEVKEDWGKEHVYIEENNEIVAAISILIKRLPAGFSVLYAPRGPVCDVYDIHLVKRLLEEVDKVAKKNKAITLKFDPEIRYSDKLYELYKKNEFKLISKGDDQEKLIQPRMNMILYLEDNDEESIMMKFSKKCRSSIRRAIRDGVNIHYSRSDEDLNIFHDTYIEMAKRNKITARSREYFTRLRDAYGEKLRIYVATHEDDILAAAITINYHGKLYYLYAGSTNVKRNLNPNHLMNYEMIKWGIEEGAESYDFGGIFEISNKNGLYLFKKSFCHKDEPTVYIGEIDKVYKPLLFWAMENFLPTIQRLRKKLNR